MIRVNMILGYQYRASTQLGSQSFDIRLDNEPRVGTPIRQSLSVWYLDIYSMYFLDLLWRTALFHRSHCGWSHVKRCLFIPHGRKHLGIILGAIFLVC